MTIKLLITFLHLDSILAKIFGGSLPNTPWLLKLVSKFSRITSEKIIWILDSLKKSLINWKLSLITCVSIIKQHWKKKADILQESHIITWSIQNFVRKVKQFVKKYYITWLITQLVVTGNALLVVLFCNCLLIDL